MNIYFDDTYFTLIVYGDIASSVERHAANELAAYFRNVFHIAPDVISTSELGESLPKDHNVFLIGTEKSLKLNNYLNNNNLIKVPDKPEGFAIKYMKNPMSSNNFLIAAIGFDPEGTLWAVRDLCHYYMKAPKETNFDGTGQSIRDVFGQRAIEVQENLDVQDWPRIKYRAFWSYARDMNIEPPAEHEYVSYNPYRWIDNMSRWKANVLQLWEGDHSLLGREPELIDYAHKRGVKIVVGMGFYSYATEVIAPPHLKRTKNRFKIHKGQLWATDRGLCPTDQKNQEWMINYTLNYIRKYRPDGLLFQTGEVDYDSCGCKNCKKFADEELFIKTVAPIIKAVRKEFGNNFWIISNQLNRPDYFKTFSLMDKNVTFMWEGSCFPVAGGVGNSPVSRIEEARHAVRLRPGNSGYLIRFYMGGMSQTWLDRRNWAIKELCEYGKALVEEDGNLFVGLFQTQLPARDEYFLPSFFSELAWNPTRPKEAIANIKTRVSQLTNHDLVRVGLLSDPPAIIENIDNGIVQTKNLQGLNRHDTIEQFHGIRGVLEGDLLQSKMMGDVLMEDSNTAEYNFQVTGKPKKAVLMVNGCLDDIEIEKKYELEISLNRNSLGKFELDWPIGINSGIEGFKNLKVFSVDLPMIDSQLWSIRLKLNAPNGWIFYDKVSLRLTY